MANSLTVKYIFQCKLKDEPVHIYTDQLTRKEMKHLTKHGVWAIDPLFTSRFWDEHAFTIMHKVWLIDSCGTVTSLYPGDHHTLML